MFIHTDLLRAALCCVADQKEERRYLQGVNITSTHIQATDGSCAVSMGHGSPDAFEGAFIFPGAIPAEAEGTYIKMLDDGAIVAEHVNGDNAVIHREIIESAGTHYPDFGKLMMLFESEPRPCKQQPIYQARLLALPHCMFGESRLPVQLISWGDGEMSRFIFDSVTNHFYGNPWLVVMPMKSNAFELLERLADEEGL